MKRYRSFKPPPIPRSFLSLNIHLNISVFEGKFVVPHGSTYLPLTFIGFCNSSFSMFSLSSLLSAILDTANRCRILSTSFGKCFAILRIETTRDIDVNLQIPERRNYISIFLLLGANPFWCSRSKKENGN